MSKPKLIMRLLLLVCGFVLSGRVLLAQSTIFTYQGKLTDAGQPANGVFDLQFALFNALNGGAQQGVTLTREDVVVTNGVFTVGLDFGAGVFPGAARFLEISVRPGASVGAFTLLTPRQPMASTPYAIQSINATNAGTAINFSGALAGDVTGTQGSTVIANNAVTTAKLADSNVTDAKLVTVAGSKITGAITTATISGANVTGAVANATTAVNFSGALAGDVTGTQGATVIANNAVTTPKLADGNVTDAKIASVAGSKITGTIPVAAVPAGSGNYIQNTNSTQTANFAISGNGTVNGTLSGNAVNATTQYNLGGTRILDANLASNLFVGLNTGTVNTAANNTFVGHNAGAANTTGPNNTFVGYIAGQTNSSGDLNTFVGSNTGRDNTTGTQNTFIGSTAGLMNTSGNFNTFIGRNAGRFNLVGNDNSFLGDDAGTNSTGLQNSFFGSFAGTATTDGDNNAFFGYRAGDGNATGSANTILGTAADVTANNLTNAAAIGFRAAVGISNALVLGGINGVNGAAADTRVGIGTITPTFRLHVRAGDQDGIKIQNNGSGSFQQIRWTDAADAFKAAISVGPVGSEDMRFFVNGGDRMIIENTGTVIISSLGAAGATTLCRNASNQISTCSSSRRYKDNIQNFSAGLNLISKLRPVTFDWKANRSQDVGLVAEEVAALDPLLATYNDKGEIEGVKYAQLSVVLINAVKEQQAQIAVQRQQIEQLQTVVQRLQQRLPASPRTRRAVKR